MTQINTIDDIFKQLSHFNRRGATVVVTHPVVRDVTDKIVEERISFLADKKYRADYEIPEGTSYFGFFDPQISDGDFIWDPTRSISYTRLLEEAKRYDENEMKKGPFDKVGQHELNDKIGIFDSIRYIDVRKISHSYRNATLYRFTPKDFADFPYDDIISDLGQLPRSYIFHNMIDGFRIRNSKSGGFTISGRSEIVKEADAETRNVKDPRQRLDAFLRKLVEKGFTLEQVGERIRSEGNENYEEGLINGIMSHKANLYIKDARTGGGYLVVRVRKEGEIVQIESDSPEFTTMLENRVRRLQNRKARYENMVRMKVPQFILTKSKESLDSYNPHDPKDILSELLQTLRNPIIEEEAPYETVNGNRAEFRMICQRVPGIIGDGLGEFVLTNYAKVSGNKVTANISHGGHGETIRDVLKGMYAQRMPEKGEDELSAVVADAAADLLLRTKDFAEKVYAHYASDNTLQKMGVEPPRDFAIDLIPKWNEQKRRIDYTFLEINHHYGYEGLKEADPDAAERVASNKVRIQESRK